MSNRILTLREVAEELRCSTSTVRQLINRGQLAALNLGTASHKHYRVTREALDEYESTASETPKPMPRVKDAGIVSKSFLKLG